jgi:hypothetical protein
VPKFSPNEDRVTIEIEPLTSGCELALTTQTADEWADDTQRGWAMILDVARRGMLGVSALRLVSSPTTLSRALACFAADEVASMNGCQNGHVDSTESHAIFL